VGRLDDLRALASVEEAGRRFEGAIVGRALYEGSFTVRQAIDAISEVRS
jgi:phosphoribosylanthranilate isomerase